MCGRHSLVKLLAYLTPKVPFRCYTSSKFGLAGGRRKALGDVVEKLREKRKKGLSEPLRQIAARFREAREQARFSQYDLAPQLGVARGVLSNVELFQNALPFRVGFEFCRRLNLAPRWLALGLEPRRPFIPIEELGVTLDRVREHSTRGMDFLEGYRELLEAPTNTWLDKHSPEEIALRSLTVDPTAAVRTMSVTELSSRLQSAIDGLARGTSAQRATHAKLAEILSAEMGARLSALERHFIGEGKLASRRPVGARGDEPSKQRE